MRGHIGDSSGVFGVPANIEMTIIPPIDLGGASAGDVPVGRALSRRQLRHTWFAPEKFISQRPVRRVSFRVLSPWRASFASKVLDVAARESIGFRSFCCRMDLYSCGSGGLETE